MADIFLRKYNQATTINFELAAYGAPEDLAQAATFAAGDVTVMKDEGAETNIGTLPTDEGKTYSLPLTATEAQAARITISIIDQSSPKVWMDKVIIVDTYGNASAEHAFDLDTATVGVTNLTVAASTTLATGTHNPQSGDSYARLGAPAGASIAADLVVIESQTDDIGAAGAGLTSVGLSAAAVDSIWDEALTPGAHNVADSAGKRIRELQESGAVYGGYVWVDTVNGSAGTDLYINGTSDNPSLTIADANTIAAGVGIDKFKVAPGSSITFAGTQQNQVFEGRGWTLALGGVNISGSTFIGAQVSGIGTNTTGLQYFIDCKLGAMTVPTDTHFIACGHNGTVTIGESGDYFWDQCFSEVAGNGTPVIDVNSVANVDLSIRHHSGGEQINNAVSTTTCSIETDGQVVVDATCTSLTLTIRGNASLTDNGTTTSITDDARFNTANTVGADIVSISGSAVAADNLELSTLRILSGTVGVGPTSTVIPTNLSLSTDDVLINRVIIFSSGTQQHEAAKITDFDFTSGDVTVEQMSATVAQNDTFVII